MDLWNRITGIVQVELTCADMEGLLASAARAGLTLHEIERIDGLRVVLRLPRKEFSGLEKLAEKWNASMRAVSREGLAYRISAWRARPVLVWILAALIAASVYLPGRILFVRVSGNETVPTRLILETARGFGLDFGASRRAVRSERIKNELLGAIEELEWVGVNTSGSVATIQVRERKPDPVLEDRKICNLVASTDGVIESVTLVRGEQKCAPGQAVREGDVLVSGFLDLGICTKTVEAEGEVYARTLRQNCAAVPKNRLRRGQERKQITKYSLLVGKNRINLYSDSGILMPTCGKMTTINQLRLPGGFTLPVALIREAYTVYETQSQPIPEMDAMSLLSDTLQRHLLENLVAGTILDQKSRVEPSEQIWILSASYECREMIARQDEGVYLQDYG